MVWLGKPLEPGESPELSGVVWHDPTAYNLVLHGPSYLPGAKLSSHQKTKLGAFAERVSYAIPGIAPPETTSTAFSLLLATLRAASLVHQSHHWQTKGPTFFEDHLLFERLYNESQDFIDQVGERIVGTAGVGPVDAQEQVGYMGKIVAHIYTVGPTLGNTPSLVGVSLFAEVYVLTMVDRLMAILKEDQSGTHGISNLLEGLADKHESFTYLLQQRWQNSDQGYTYDHG